MAPVTKICNRCFCEHPLIQFKGFLCSSCRNQRQYKWRAKNREKWLALKRKSDATNREKILVKDRSRKNSEKGKQKRQERYQKMMLDPIRRDKHRKQRRIYSASRKTRDPQFVLMARLRTRTYMALQTQGSRKFSKTKEMLGCDIPTFRKWIGSQFQPGMTWDNYGKFWELDHKKPCSYFDLTDPEQQKICFHFTNFQPLTVIDNRKKSNKYAE